jgi:hypothetical protein
MAKQKVEKAQMIIIPKEPNRIYIYVRPWKLLNPIPYPWKLNLIEFKKLKNLINDRITD